MALIRGLFSNTESLYGPSVALEIGNSGNTSVNVTIQPPSLVVNSATIVDYQLIISNSENEETMTVSSSTL